MERKPQSLSSDSQMPNLNRLVENKPVVVLRDTDSSEVIVRDLVKEEQLTGKVGYVMKFPHTLLKATFANVKVSTS